MSAANPSETSVTDATAWSMSVRICSRCPSTASASRVTVSAAVVNAVASVSSWSAVRCSASAAAVRVGVVGRARQSQQRIVQLPVERRLVAHRGGLLTQRVGGGRGVALRVVEHRVEVVAHSR